MKGRLGVFMISIVSTALASYADDSCRTLDHIGLTSQIVVVKSVGGFKADITACEWRDEEWIAVTPTFPGVVGKNGVAANGEKQEGDGKTPSGLFAMGPAFGSQTFAVKMDYQHITSEDKFVDDPISPEYNTWITGEAHANSYELMLHPLYRIGAVVQYNMHPVIPWKGSAIFLHLWRSSEDPTGGCVAMDEVHLKGLLHWFDKAKHPHIFISN